jgi:hypothetical protein
MALLVAWIFFPLMLALVCAGLGLLVERAAGLRLRGALIVPIGLAALVAVAQLTTYWSATARLTTPLVVVLATAGGVFAQRAGRLSRLVLDWPPLLAALGVFAVLGAPVFLSGEPTFVGYTVLGDTAIQFLTVDQMLEHGRSLSGLTESSYRSAIAGYFDSGYPMGSQVALGAIRPLSGLDVAWVYQPYLAFVAASLALSLYALTERLITSRWLRGAIAFVAAQPALVVAYSLQGSIKEMATVMLVPLLVATLIPLFADRGRPRAVIPLAVASVAGIAAIGPAVAPWLAPVVLVALVAAVVGRSSWREVALQAGAFAAIVLVLSFPTIAELGRFADVSQGVVTASEEFGNLLAPLRPLQAFGIWLSGDYRLGPSKTFSGLDALTLTWVLIGVALASAAIGLAWALARFKAAALPLLYIAVSVVAVLYVTRIGSPWADGKALMITSPALVLAALLGPAALLASRSREGRAAALLVGGAIAVGVLGSNALAYHGASLAPYDRFEELREIGKQQRDAGPTLYTEFEEFGKHFLHPADPTSPSEAFQPALAVGAGGARFAYPADLDAVGPAYVDQFETIVTRRSPVASRPPIGWELRSSGRWYDVWHKRADAPEVLQHLALGGDLSAGASARCADVRRLAVFARAAGAQLATATSAAPVALLPETARDLPAAWAVDGGIPHTVATVGQGQIEGTIEVPHSGRWSVWLGGSFGRPVTVEVDGHTVGTLRDELSGPAQYAPLGTLELTQGRHAVRIWRGGGSLAPGNGSGPSRRLGPLMLVPEPAAGESDAAASARVRTLGPDGWRALCGERLDWIEVVRPR